MTLPGLLPMARILTALLSAVALLAVGQLSHAAPTTPEEYWSTVLPDSPLPEAILWLLHPETKALGSDKRYSSVSSDDILAKKLSTLPLIYYKQRMALLNDKYGQGKHLSHPTPAVADNADHKTKALGSDKRYSSVSSDDILAKKLSTLPLIYYKQRMALLNDKYGQGKHLSHPTPAVADNADHGMDNMTFFFRQKEVQVGNSMSFYFPPAQSAPLGLLPRSVADSIPFSSSALPSILARFGIPGDSSLAANMEITLKMCEMPPIAGEVTFCATSLEALVDGAMAALGTRDISLVTSDLPHSGSPPLQPYTIRAVRPIDSSSFMSCHYADYPYTVYACHQVSSTRLYKMEMEGLSGNMVTLVVVCHADTSDWDPNYIAFKILGGKPGGAPICHFLPYGNMIWSKKENHSSA